jgi:RNA-directed DNA polymerase
VLRLSQHNSCDIYIILAGLREELVSKTYRPDPVQRVSIPKPDGGERPIYTPTVSYRLVVAQSALAIYVGG